MTTLDAADPATLATAWLAVDPDARTRAETQQLLEAGGAALTDRFGHHLVFGTAGLRGALGTGPNRMNRVLVRLVAAALVDELGAEPDPHLVIGYDARHGSADFAIDTARVALARGTRCTILPRPLPTPVLAFTVRNLDASAGVMVTASHNPRTDNGYKVYGRGGALLTAPFDEQIAGTMARTPLLGDEDLAPVSDANLPPAPEQLIEDYVHAVVAGLRPTSPRTARTAYTALHGVGNETVIHAFTVAGFEPPSTVAAQADPDPDFPTAPFPNPEEPGSMDLVLELGREVGADLAIANDPDADRLAVAVPTEQGWRALSGDDVGSLLADHLLRRTGDDDPRPPLVVTTVTSSRLLSKLAAAYGAAHAETLTGFKWIMHARDAHPDHRLVCGYEEALGYAVNEAVPDKDGISAALVITELASELKEAGTTLLDRLDEIHAAHGVHVNGQRSIRFEGRTDGASGQQLALAHLRDHAPATLAGTDVAAVKDLAKSETGLRATEGLVLEMEGARVVIRPSGTEPKMKVYGEVVADGMGDTATVRREARARLRQLLDDAVTAACSFDTPQLSSPEPDPRIDEVFATPPRSPTQRRADLELIVRCIDLTTPEGDETAARVRALCAQARRPDPANPAIGPVAAVCIHPALVDLVRELLAGTTIDVASVADERIQTPSRPTLDGGADFSTTATGRAAVEATPAAVWTMAQAIKELAATDGRPVGIKIAGGVRSADDALGYVNIVREVLGEEWLRPDRFRIGASTLLDAVIAELD